MGRCDQGLASYFLLVRPEGTEQREGALGL